MSWLGRIAIIGIGSAVVRETVGAIFVAVGWGPWLVAAISTVGVIWGTWAEDKTALDITVYGLATFASVSFLGWLISQLIAAIRGVPMTLAIRERLTFGEIADRWAAEMAGHPGALTRDEILEQLLEGVWEGFFEDKDGNSQLILTAPAVVHLKQDDYGEWNRQTLLSAMLPRIQRALPEARLPSRMDLTPAPDSTPEEWSDLRKTIPWSDIKKLRLSIYDDGDRTSYIEPLSVSKRHFRRWARKTRRSLPQFWFS